jgi:hydroxymethylpyrimidine pyrophosphatase-like HAD family hydrolase
VTDAARTPECEALMSRVCGDDAYVTRSNPEFVEMLNPHVDKGRALGIVAAQHGIPLARIMAIGDSYNDLPLAARGRFRGGHGFVAGGIEGGSGCGGG